MTDRGTTTHANSSTFSDIRSAKNSWGETVTSYKIS